MCLFAHAVFAPFICPNNSKVKNVAQINEQELRAGLTGTKASWHEQYKDSAYIYVGMWWASTCERNERHGCS